LSNALQKLEKFVDYVEKLAKESKHSLSPKKTAILRADFTKLTLLAQAEHYRSKNIISEIELLKNKFDAILAEAESRFELYKAEIDCKWLKYIFALLIGGGILGFIFKYLVS